MRVFDTSVRWWSFTWVWMTASLLKSPLVSRTLLSILADLNNAAVWLVSTRLLISKSSSPFTNPLGIVPSAPITTGITVTFMFHSFFVCFFIVMSRYLSLFSLSFYFYSVIHRKGKVYLTITKVWSSGRDFVIRLYLKIPGNFVCFILRGEFRVLHIPLVAITLHIPLIIITLLSLHCIYHLLSLHCIIIRR